ncbi:MAG TPA: virulence factor [Candidatus Nanopelagicaceae bacterium]|nr:virulence factor [Candidatus Nanopelagicaceae bacterium]
MSEYQIMMWRDFPSLVVARSGDTVIKVSLPARFQEAIDEAAVRLGEIGSDAYISGWVRTAWTSAEGEPDEVANTVADRLLQEFTEARMTEILDSLNADTTE